MADASEQRLLARNDLAWAITLGGIGIVLFAAMLWFAWQFAATLFLILAGMLLGVALNALTQLLGRLVPMPQALRVALVCLTPAVVLSGVVRSGAGGGYHRKAAGGPKPADQVAIVHGQGVPGKDRRRHQLFRKRPGRDGRDRCRGNRGAGNAGPDDAPQSAERQHARLVRR